MFRTRRTSLLLLFCAERLCTDSPQQLNSKNATQSDLEILRATRTAFIGLHILSLLLRIDLRIAAVRLRGTGPTRQSRKGGSSNVSCCRSIGLFHESEKIGIHLVRQRCAHPVRRARIDLQDGVL